MYKESGNVSKTLLKKLLPLMAERVWTEVENDIHLYQSKHVSVEAKKIKAFTDKFPVDTWKNVLLTRLVPGGYIGKHSDTGKGITIPLETNDKCEPYLEVGKMYETDRSVEHSATNNGKTNRTYLIICLR